jgi:hypothetical protein
MNPSNPQTMLGIACLFTGTTAALHAIFVPAGLCFVLGVVLLSVDFNF